MKLIDKPLTDLLDDFRKPAPTPGGGSAAALSGAVGASLLAMVAALPKPRATEAADLERLREAGEHASRLSVRLAELIDRDTEAYDDVMAAYRLPKSTEEEKRARSAAIQDALRGATETPLDVMRACRDALRAAPAVETLGNRSASSDLQVGVELLRTGLRGARLNVEINLESLKDAAYVARIREEVASLAAEVASDRR